MDIEAWKRKLVGGEPEEMVPWRPEKHPPDIDAVRKSHPHFAFFLLTDFLHPPILKIQIRGNVEAPDRNQTHETGPGF